MERGELVEELTAEPAVRPGFVAPRYDGRGLANVMPAGLRHFGVPTPYPGLDPRALPPALLDGVRHLVLFVVDGLGYRQLLGEFERQPDLHLARLIRDGRAHLAPLTSVFPSTTTTALPTLHTGAVPAAHGALGYTLYLPEFGAVTEMIYFGPYAGRWSYADAGFDPTPFLRVPPVWAALSAARVDASLLNYAPFERSPLTRMLGEGARFVPYLTLTDMVVNLRRLLERTGVERSLTLVYHGMLDLLAHRYGADSPSHPAEVAAIDAVLHRELLARLRQPETLLLLLADHGHLDCPPERMLDLRAHPELLDCLVAVAGEPRVRYLHVRDGCLGAARQYLAERFGDHSTVLDREEAFALGLFGGDPRELADLTERSQGRRSIRYRAGDLILLPHANWWFHHALPENRDPPPMIGRHGGLTPEEMLVPLLALRLG